MHVKELFFLNIVEPHELASYIVPETNDIPVIIGPGNDIMACGKCSAPLVDGYNPETFKSFLGAPVQAILKCPKCGAMNELPATIAGLH